MTEIPTDEGKLCLSTAIDLFSRRLLGYATSAHTDADLADQTVKMTIAARSGAAAVAGVIFHSDRGSTYTAYGSSVSATRSALCKRWAGPDRHPSQRAHHHRRVVNLNGGLIAFRPRRSSGGEKSVKDLIQLPELHRSARTAATYPADLRSIFKTTVPDSRDIRGQTSPTLRETT